MGFIQFTGSHTTPTHPIGLCERILQYEKRMDLVLNK